MRTRRSNPKSCRICVNIESETSRNGDCLDYCAVNIDTDLHGEYLRIPAGLDRDICSACDSFHRYREAGPARHIQRAHILQLRQLEIDRQRNLHHEKREKLIVIGTVSLVLLTVVLAIMTIPMALDAGEKVFHFFTG